MKPKAALRHFLALAGSSLLAVSCASAATRNWEGDVDALWATAGNWDTAPANSLLTDIVNFNLATYGGNPVFAPTVGTATSINGITIGASNGTMTLTSTAALSIGDGGISIANGAGAFTISGSTTLGASQSWTNNSGSLFSFGAVTAGANTLTIGGSGDTTASGIISGTNGALTKEGAGLLTLNAANTYTGATTVNGGELRWGIANAINAGALRINDGGTVNMQTFADSVGTVTIAKGGAITGTTGTLTTTSLVSNNGGSISRIVLNNLTYNDTISGSTTLSIDRLELKQGTFNIARGDDASGVDLDITTVIFGDGNGRSLIKSGSGVMRLSGATASTSLGTGTLSIQDGTVIFNKSAEVAAFGGGGEFTIGDGTGDANSAVLRYQTSSNQIGGNAITINSDGLFDLNGFSESIGSSLIMNGGSITTGVGTLTLTASSNTISGTSTVTGKLTFDRGTNANTLVLGGTASINGTTTFIGSNSSVITATGNTSIAGTLVLGSNARGIAVTNASDVLTISATTSGTGVLTKSGAGTLIATAASALPQHATSGRVVINGGTLGVRVGGSGWTTTEVNTLLTNATKTSGALGIDTTNGDLTQWAAFTTANFGTALGLTKLGSNTLTLDQTNTYNGNTRVDQGVLNTTSAVALSGYTTSGSVIVNGGTLGVRVGGTGWTTGEVDTMLTNATKTSGALGIDTTNGGLTQWTAFTPTNLGSTLGLTKLGSNTLTLDQANTYNGATTVSQGTLALGATGSIANSSTITVATGATLDVSAASGGWSLGATQTLGGTGTVTGAVTIDGNLNPGASPGVLSFSNALALGANSTTTMEIDGMTRGTGYDGVNVGTTLALDGDLLLDIGTILSADGTFDLFAVTGATSGDFNTVTLQGLMGTGSFSFAASDVWSLVDGNNTWTFTESTGDLSLSIIPEPGAALLGGLGILLIFRRRR